MHGARGTSENTGHHVEGGAGLVEDGNEPK